MFKEKINKDLIELIQQDLEAASNELDISFDYENQDIIIYGSVFNKEEPNDIDIFIKLKINLENSNKEYQNYNYDECFPSYYQGELEAINSIKNYLHGYTPLKKQTLYKRKKIDINVEAFNFKEGKFNSYNEKNYQQIEEFIEQIKKPRKKKKPKNI